MNPSIFARVLVVLAVAAAGCASTSAPSSATAAPNAPSSATAAPTESHQRPPTSEIKARLSPLAFEVTQNGATEPPFRNPYWDQHADGIYVDVVSGEPLFSSRDKFDSGTGWPSFSRPLSAGSVAEHLDTSLGSVRTEVVSKAAGSHLGHVFEDGPAPTHRRYCMNSAALGFIPADRLVTAGYGAYAAMFAVGAAAAAVPPPAMTTNSCALPPPGKKPGCRATLEVALFGGLDGDDRIAPPAGVLEVVRGRAGGGPAVEVVYDPAKVSYADLLRQWTRGREGAATIYPRDAAQRRIAQTSALRVVDVAPFQRE